MQFWESQIGTNLFLGTLSIWQIVQHIVYAIYTAESANRYRDIQENFSIASKFKVRIEAFD